MRVPQVASRTRKPGSQGDAAGGKAAAVRHPRKSLLSYFRRLWLGELPLARAFWTDMLVVGTLVNLATLIAAIVLLGHDAPLAYGVVLFLVHIPYSIALAIGVWRSAARENSKWSAPAQAAAVVWLIAALLT